ncbi:MAG: hypothetical protein IRZ28_14885 [Steroidobacteraceae bacterium]|nr:hypothetical protein [Steroidobacteraceae bacterium]
METRIDRLESYFASLARDVGRIESDVGHLRARLAGVESDVKQLVQRQERDFRVLFGALMTVAVGLATLLAKGFGWIG